MIYHHINLGWWSILLAGWTQTSLRRRYASPLGLPTVRRGRFSTMMVLTQCNWDWSLSMFFFFFPTASHYPVPFPSCRFEKSLLDAIGAKYKDVPALYYKVFAGCGRYRWTTTSLAVEQLTQLEGKREKNVAFQNCSLYRLITSSLNRLIHYKPFKAFHSYSLKRLFTFKP